MLFNMSTYLEAQVLNLVLNHSGWSPPAAVYLALFTALNEASDGVTYTEVSAGGGSGYGRVAATFGAFSGGSSSNTNLIDFPLALTDWGSCTHFGIFDASSGGNLLYWGEVQGGTPVTVLAGQQFEVPIGQLTVTIAGTLTSYLANKIGDHTLRNVAYASPATVYLAVLTSFTNDASYVELVDTNYARQVATWGTATNPVGNPPAVVQNTNTITFPGPASAYTANYLALFDTATSGNMLLRGPMSPPKSVPVGQTFVFPPANITISAD